MKLTCPRCGVCRWLGRVPGPSVEADRRDGAALCFDCWLERPFERDIICNICGEEKPIVRLYLQGPACDECNADRNPQPAVKGDPPS